MRILEFQSSYTRGRGTAMWGLREAIRSRDMRKGARRKMLARDNEGLI